MSLYQNRLIMYARRARGISLVAPGYSKDRVRDYLSRSIGSLVAGLAADDKGMWAHQVEALGAIHSRIADASSAPVGLVVIPTGGGKTEIFQRIVSATSRVSKDGKRFTPNTIVLVPTLQLVGQTVNRFLDRFPELDGMVGAMGSDLGEDLAHVKGARPVTVMTYEGFVRAALAGDILPEDIHLLVMDEAHRALSDLRREAFAPYLETVPTLAFSATPGFSETKSLYDLLGAQAEIVNVPASRLREEGIITPAVNYVLRVRIEGPLPQDPIQAAHVRRSAIVRALRDFREEHRDADGGDSIRERTTLGFLRDRAHSAMAAEAFNENVAPGEPPFRTISGNDSPEEQAARLDAMREGRVAGLFNSLLLGEGSDFPEVGAVLMAPSASGLQVVQMGGRAVRFDPRYPRDDRRQTAYIVNTAVEVDGKVLGNPVPYWKVLQDYGIARNVESRILTVDELMAVPPDPEADLPDMADLTSPLAAPTTPPAGPDTPDDPEESPEIPAPNGTDLPEPPGTGPIEVPPEAAALPLDLGHESRYTIQHVETMVAGIHSARVSRERPGWRDAHGVAKTLNLRLDDPEVGPAMDAVLAKTSEASASGASSFRWGSLEIPFSIDDLGRGPVVLFGDDALPRLAAILGTTCEPATPEWFLRKHIKGGKWAPPDMTRILDGIDAEYLERYRAGHPDHVVMRDEMRTRRNRRVSVSATPVPPIPIRVGMRLFGNGRAVCYHVDSLPGLSRVIGLAREVPPISAEWMTRKEAERLFGGRSPASDALFQRLEDDYVRGEEPGVDERRLDVDGRVFTVARRATATHAKPVVYARSDVELMLDAMGRTLYPAPGPSDLNYVSLAKRLGTHPSLNMDLRSIRNEVVEAFTATGKASLGGVALNMGIKRVQGGGRPGFYWDESCVPLVAAELARRKEARLESEEEDLPSARM